MPQQKKIHFYAGRSRTFLPPASPDTLKSTYSEIKALWHFLCGSGVNGLVAQKGVWGGKLGRKTVIIVCLFPAFAQPLIAQNSFVRLVLDCRADSLSIAFLSIHSFKDFYAVCSCNAWNWNRFTACFPLGVISIKCQVVGLNNEEGCSGWKGRRRRGFWQDF